MATNSLKTGSECVLGHPKKSRVIFGKNTLTTFWSRNGPLEGLLGSDSSPKGPKRGQNGPKMCPERVFLWDTPVCAPIRTHFGAILGPFWAVLGPVSGLFGTKSHHLRDKNRQKMTNRQPARCPSGYHPKIWPPDPGGACPRATGPRLGPFWANFWGHFWSQMTSLAG